ncbi:MAG: alanine--tRNA ligase, partial [Pseudomonadota bacterium]
AYPELSQGQAMIEETLLLEETRFKTTLDRGLKLLDDELAGLDAGKQLPGDSAFKLYDTYGFPLDLTQDALRERGREVDVSGFDAAMAEQKAKARAAWSGSGAAADDTIWFDVADANGATDFLGYDTETAEGQILAIVKDGTNVEEAFKGDAVQIALNQTPFYAESGGQIGDSGILKAEGATVRITDTRKSAGVFVHFGTVEDGSLTKTGAELTVDHARRTAIRANHSATHLLHEALRVHLGDHVAQRGSLNADDRLRFDFSHTKALSLDELKQVEVDVNAFIRQNTSVDTRIMTPDDARAMGAQALFGEKYGDEVRVVSMGRQPGSGKGLDQNTYSLELCGGTHVGRTGDIGAFVALSDSASSSGVRRIEALTGQAALDYLQGQDLHLSQTASVLKAQPQDVANRVQMLLEERKALQAEVADLRKKVAMGGSSDTDGPDAINGIKFIGRVLKDVPARDLRGVIDEQKTVLGSGVVVLISDTGGKAAVAVGVTNDLTDKLSAVDLVKAAAEALGGKGGGGRPDMAQAGGPSAENADAALHAVKTILEE